MSSVQLHWRSNANITIDVLVKICNALECDFSDIMEMVPVEEKANFPKKHGRLKG